MAQDLQHLLVVPNLLRACRVAIVGHLVRNFVKHLDEVHVHARVPLDESLEFLDDGDEGLRVFGHMLSYAIKILPVNAMVSW